MNINQLVRESICTIGEKELMYASVQLHISTCVFNKQ